MSIDKSLAARLGRLFSTQVVVRRVGSDKKKLRIVDTNRLQSAGNLNFTRAGKYTQLQSRNGYSTSSPNAYNFHTMKILLYADYESMDTDAILSSALDIYADESTVKSASDELLVIKSDDPAIKKILYNLFYEILNVDTNLWSWIRNLCKYGDFHLYLDIHEPEEGEQSIGIKNVIPLSPYAIERQEGLNPNNPYDVSFKYENVNSMYANNIKTDLEFFRVAHFRLLSDTNFLPYGKSMIEPARKIYKQLVLMEDAMLLSRIMRAPERRIFKIDVGGIPPAEVDQHMANIISKMKKVPYIDPSTGEYNLKFNLQNMMEDYYLATRGGESNTSIDTLDGLKNEGQIEDIEYLRNKEMAALKIPKAFLGYDADVSGKATLAAEDVRFARTIERIQRAALNELTKIAIVHLFSQGHTDASLVNFELSLTSPSIIYERQKVELLKEKVELISSMIEGKMISEKWMYENIYNMNEEQWMMERSNVIEDLKNTFRKKQIEDEGNDPQVTKQSYGTVHDIAALHLQNRSADKTTDMRTVEHIPGPGRDKAPTNFESNRDVDGKDPLGMKALHNNQDKLSSESVNYRNTKLIKNLTETFGKKIKLVERKTFMDEEVLNTPV